MTTRNDRQCKSPRDMAAQEVAAILSRHAGSLFTFRHKGRTFNGFLVDSRLAPDHQAGYDIILIVTHDRVISGPCQIDQEDGRTLACTATTERLESANRVTLRVQMSRHERN